MCPSGGLKGAQLDKDNFSLGRSKPDGDFLEIAWEDGCWLGNIGDFSLLQDCPLPRVLGDLELHDDTIRDILEHVASSSVETSSGKYSNSSADANSTCTLLDLAPGGVFGGVWPGESAM